MQQLQVSPDGHFLQSADGAPIFYLGDTAWLLFNKLTLPEVERYLADRAAKGFTVIQAVAFRDLFAPNTPNVAGVHPFVDEVAMRAVQLNPAWLDHVRTVIGLARKAGLRMGLLPTWGDKWNEHSNSAGPVIMDAASARAYTRQLSDALADADNTLWILGGDSPVQTQAHADVVHAMAAGIREGGSGGDLVTFHPCHDAAADIFHAAPWLDFNCLQSGHAHPSIADYRHLEHQYRLKPPKPCVNLEPNYEWCPMFAMLGEPIPPAEQPVFSAYDVRKCLYRSVLAGGCGFTYGCEPIRQLYRTGDQVHVFRDYPLPTWEEALAAPGSAQLQHLVRLLLERRYFSREPAQDRLLPRTVFRGVAMDSAVPGNDHPAAHVRVAQCREGGYLLAYCPVRQLLTLDTSGLRGDRFTVSLYDPETGARTCRYARENTGTCVITPTRDLDTFIALDACP